jgi:hypothetical protein
MPLHVDINDSLVGYLPFAATESGYANPIRVRAAADDVL